MLSDPVTQVNATTTVERLAALENSMIFLIAILGVKFSRPFFLDSLAGEGKELWQNCVCSRQWRTEGENFCVANCRPHCEGLQPPLKLENK